MELRHFARWIMIHFDTRREASVNGVQTEGANFITFTYCRHADAYYKSQGIAARDDIAYAIAKDSIFYMPSNMLLPII
jgi:hypothetical protein